MTNPLIGAPGFYPEITCEQYFAEPCPAAALTNSGIRLLSPPGAAPAKFAYQHPAIGAEPEKAKDTASQYRGRLVHRLALGKGQDYAVSPYDEYRSNEAKEWRNDQIAAGIMPVKQKDFDAAEEMAAVARGRIAEACHGKPYQTEVVAAWQEEMSQGPVWCRIMIDIWCPDLLLALDLKSFADASDIGLEKAFANGGCVTQHCFYKRGLEKLTAEHGRVRFGFLVVESEPPYLTRLATPTGAYRHGAELEVRRSLAIFSDCLSRGEWPGYQEALVSPPAWLLNRWSASGFMEGTQ